MIKEMKNQNELEQVSGGMLDVASIFASLSTRTGTSSSTAVPSNEPRSTRTSSFNSFGGSTSSRALASDSSTGESLLSLFGNARGFNGFR